MNPRVTPSNLSTIIVSLLITLIVVVGSMAILYFVIRIPYLRLF